MKFAKRLSILCLAFSMLFLCGCWNYRDLETLSIVSAIAIDDGQQGGRYHLTFQYLDMGGSQTQPKLLETEGDTIFDAVRNTVKVNQNKLYFSENKVVIISEQLARRGIKPLLDWLIRDSETRVTVKLIISREETAAEVLKQEENATTISGFSISEAIQNAPKYSGKNVDIALYQALQQLSTKGDSLCLPAVSMMTNQELKLPALNGTAVFRSDRLIGYLDESQSRSLLFIQDQLKGGLLLTSGSGTGNDDLSLEILQSSTAMSCSIQGDQVTIRLKILTKVSLEEENTPMGVGDHLVLTDVQKNAQNTIRQGIEELIHEAQQTYGSDIIGFGSCVYRSHPDYWKTHEENWDVLFPQVKVEISPEVSVEGTGLSLINIEK